MVKFPVLARASGNLAGITRLSHRLERSVGKGRIKGNTPRLHSHCAVRFVYPSGEITSVPVVKGDG
jgi:hypothetical protein